MAVVDSAAGEAAVAAAAAAEEEEEGGERSGADKVAMVAMVAACQRHTQVSQPRLKALPWTTCEHPGQPRGASQSGVPRTPWRGQ